MEKNPLRQWRPIFEGKKSEEVAELVQSIASELLLPQSRSATDGNDASLAGGKTGMALFYTYLDQALSKKDNEQTAIQLLEEAIAALAERPMPPSLYGGFTGIAWAVEHLQSRLFDPDEDLNEGIDGELLDYLNKTPWLDDYDLISGLVGYGVYALERLPRPSAVECLERVILRLDELAVKRPEGITWFTRPGLLPDHQRDLCPDGYYNLGLAHGMPGVIALLGEACAAGVATSMGRPLLNGAVDWLIAQKLTNSSNMLFSSWVCPGIEPSSARLAWCYGDLGVAAALLYAARSVNEPDWEREAISIALHATQCPVEEAKVIDAGLCHGAAGVGHIFNRIYQATGESQFKQSALFWFERALAMRQPGQGITGFSAWFPNASGENQWVVDPGLLTGAAGIGLALLAATTPVEPSWDRMLLVSIPPQSF